MSNLDLEFAVDGWFERVPRQCGHPMSKCDELPVWRFVNYCDADQVIYSYTCTRHLPDSLVVPS